MAKVSGTRPAPRRSATHKAATHRKSSTRHTSSTKTARSKTVESAPVEVAPVDPQRNTGIKEANYDVYDTVRTASGGESSFPSYTPLPSYSYGGGGGE